MRSSIIESNGKEDVLALPANNENSSCGRFWLEDEEEEDEVFVVNEEEEPPPETDDDDSV
jgi:hypothetical protein